MTSGDEIFRTSLRSLLNERLTDAEEQSLNDEGFSFKKPTRKAAVMVALYKKAASGDLAAIKELRSIAGGKTDSPSGGKAVMIIDDISG